MADDSWFGEIKDGNSAVEVPVYNTLSSWFPVYLEEKERQMGQEQGLFPAPRSYTNESEFEKFPEDQIPAVIIVSPGMIGDPVREGAGVWSADFLVVVATVTGAKDRNRTRALSKIYQSVARTILLQQHPGTRWLDESWDDLPDEDGRQLAAALGSFSVWVTDLASDMEGPTGPPDQATQPGGDWPTVQDVIIEWERKEDE